jgi:glutamate-1-semialdehyde 2,1-aminomutase
VPFHSPLSSNDGCQCPKGYQYDKENCEALNMVLIKSLEMQERAAKRIPGMTQLLSKRPDQFSLGIWPGYFSRAKGVEVWDLDGNHYIDMSISGIGANVLGYADPDVDGAVKHAIECGNSSSLNCPEEVELADLLCEIHPWADMVRYARTGGEAMAIAIRIARTFTRRDKVAFCGYHGWHDWYLAANLGTENALGEHLLSGLNPAGVPKGLTGTAIPFRYNHIEELKDIVNKNKTELAAIIMEPIRNIWPEPGFLGEVRKLADETRAVFIIDEISSGFRLNSGGAHIILNVEPDIAVFSKALGNGYPIAAVIGRTKIMEAAQSTFISSTNWTERIGPTAAIATIKKHRKVDAASHLMMIGKKIQEGWRYLASQHGLKIDIGGIPPLSHLSFKESNPLTVKALFVQLMLERGFLASTLFYSMYAHQNHHVEKYLRAVEESFAEISEFNQKGEIEKRLRGLPASEGFKRLA